MAYHVVLHAVEARAGISALDRFWIALRHATSSQLPYRRYHEAGLRRAREGASTGVIERAVAEWLATDLNPVVQAGRIAGSATGVMAGYNAYNAHARLSVRTSAALDASGVPVAHRQLVDTRVDPEPCRVASVSLLHAILAEVRSRGPAGSAPLSIREVARRLGVESSASAQAAEVFEARGAIAVSELTRELGCGQRTLERHLKAEGGTAEGIRVAARLVTATSLLRSSLNLTQVAFEAGFSDAAHMTRSFKSACDMPPTRLREVIAAGASQAAKGSRSAAA